MQNDWHETENYLQHYLTILNLSKRSWLCSQVLNTNFLSLNDIYVQTHSVCELTTLAYNFIYRLLNAGKAQTNK